MKKIFAETFPSGKPEASITSITLVNNTAKTQDITVPTDSMWLIQTIKATNPDDVQRTTYIRLYNESAKTNLIANLIAAALNATQELYYPNSTTASTQCPNALGQGLLLAGGMTISVTWAAGGASTGGTDADGLVVFYREYPMT